LEDKKIKPLRSNIIVAAAEMIYVMNCVTIFLIDSGVFAETLPSDRQGAFDVF